MACLSPVHDLFIETRVAWVPPRRFCSAVFEGVLCGRAASTCASRSPPGNNIFTRKVAVRAWVCRFRARRFPLSRFWSFMVSWLRRFTENGTEKSAKRTKPIYELMPPPPTLYLGKVSGALVSWVGRFRAGNFHFQGFGVLWCHGFVVSRSLETS